LLRFFRSGSDAFWFKGRSFFRTKNNRSSHQVDENAILARDDLRAVLIHSVEVLLNVRTEPGKAAGVVVPHE
jgi:hypothetical protein